MRLTHRANCLLLGFAACLAASPSCAEIAAPATAVAPSEAQALLLRGEIFQLQKIDAMLARRDLAGAEAALAGFTPHSQTARFYLGYLHGLLARLKGRDDEAVKIYRAILTADPRFARVRMQLAETLTQMGDIEGATHHLDLLAAEAGRDDVADRLRSISSQLKSLKRWYFRTNLSAIPTTNINNAPASPNVVVGGLPLTLDPRNQHRSGIGAFYGFDAGGSLPLAQGVNLIGAVSVNNQDFRGKPFDDRNVRVSLGPQFYSGQNYAGFEPFAMRRWFGGERYSISEGGKVYAHFALPFGQRLTTSVSAARQYYDKLEYQNGWHGGWDAALETLATPTSFWRVGLSVDYDHTHQRHIDYVEGGASLGHYHELPYGISLFPQISFAYRQYVGVFPLTTSRRDDRRYGASLVFTKRDWIWFGFAPRVIYMFTLNKSNIALYKYTRHDLRLSLVRDF